MTNRTNKYPGRCSRCGEWAEPGEGVTYKDWPYKAEQRWKVRCADETVCAARIAERDRIANDEQATAHRNGTPHLIACRWVERYPNLPNTVRLGDDTDRLTISVRRNKNGTASVLYRRETDGEVERSSDRHRTTVDARAAVIGLLRDIQWDAPHWWADASKVLTTAKGV